VQRRARRIIEASPVAGSRDIVPATSGRAALYLIVQCSTVELFQSQAVALAPLGGRDRSKARPDECDLTGVIALAGPKPSGVLTLSLDRGVSELLPSAPSRHARHDVLRELTNQLAGRIKNRLLKFQLPLSIGLPFAVRSDDPRARGQSPHAVTCAFRTRRGLVVVMLDGIDEKSLDYSSSVRVASEGDFISF
jgi:hypothetical protein